MKLPFPPRSWLLASLLLPQLASADVVRDGTVGAGGVGAVGPGQGADHWIAPELGQQEGGNLFHSFDELSVEAGKLALYTGPDTVERILSRVTGGTRSQIDGTVRSAIEGADFILINPWGITVGGEGDIDVSGSLYLTTADYVSLGADGLFSASDPGSSVLTMSAPSAFGFLPRAEKERPGIEIFARPPDGDDPGFSVPEGETLGLVGDGIEANGRDRPDNTFRPLLNAPGGTVVLVSVASEGEVPVGENGLADLTLEDLDDFAALGDIDLIDVDVWANANAAGSLLFYGDEILIEFTLIENVTIDGDAGRFEIRGRGDVNVVDSTIDSVLEGAGTNSSIWITGSDVELSEGARARSYALDGAGASGTVGKIRVDATGSLTLLSRTRRDVNATQIRSRLRDEAGGGGIEIFVDGDLTLQCVETGGPNCQKQPAIEAIQSGGAADVEPIVIDAEDIVLRDAAVIRSSADHTASARGADVSITAHGSISVSGFDPNLREKQRSSIHAETTGGGHGGALTIETPGVLEVAEGGRIFTESRDGSGEPGDLTLRVGRLEVSRDGEVLTTTRTGSDAGNLEVHASEAVDVRGTDLTGDLFDGVPTGIQSRNQVEDGDAGDVHIVTPSLTVREGGLVTTLALVEGDGGGVSIQAGTVDVRSGGVIDSSTLLFGQGGSVTIDASQSVTVEGADSRGRPSRIGSVAVSMGDAGDVAITTPLLTVDGGVVATTTVGVSELPLEMDVDIGLPVKLHFEGTLRKLAGDIDLLVPQIDFTDQDFEDGDAGRIDLDVGRLVVTGGGQVDTSSFSAGQAGVLSVQASDEVVVSGEGSAIQSRPGPGGSGGGIAIDAPLIILEEGGRLSIGTTDATLDLADFLAAFEAIVERELSGTVGLGSSGVELTLPDFSPELFNQLLAAARAGQGSVDAGSVTLATENLVIDGGSIVAGAENATGGNVSLAVEDVLTMKDGLIDASVTNGTGGSIDIEVGDTLAMENSAIRAGANPGSGGNITIEVEEMLHLDGSEISTNVTEGQGGNIVIDPVFVILENGSRIVAQAEEGQGGNIDITAEVFLVEPDSLVSASAAVGIDGNVEIRSPETDVAGTLAALPETFGDASGLLRQRCAAREGGERRGSFVVKGRDGWPATPDGYLVASAPPGETATGSIGATPDREALVLAALPECP